MLFCIGIGAYLLVTLALLGYSRLTGGPWIGTADFMLDLLFCVLWPLSLAVLLSSWLCTLFCGKDGGRWHS